MSRVVGIFLLLNLIILVSNVLLDPVVYFKIKKKHVVTDEKKIAKILAQGQHVFVPRENRF